MKRPAKKPKPAAKPKPAKTKAAKAPKPWAPVPIAVQRHRHQAALKAAHTRHKHAAAAKSHARKLAHPPTGDQWILGANDTLNSCAAAAAANSLLAVTGWRATTGQVVALHEACGAEDDLTLARLMETLTTYGLAGIRPVSVSRAPLGAREPGLILGVELAAPHAVTVAPSGLFISWGAEHDTEGWPVPDEAWEVIWP